MLVMYLASDYTIVARPQ